jgi:hypothetical protein
MRVDAASHLLEIKRAKHRDVRSIDSQNLIEVVCHGSIIGFDFLERVLKQRSPARVHQGPLGLRGSIEEARLLGIIAYSVKNRASALLAA